MNHFIKVFKSLNFPVAPRHLFRAIELISQRGVQDVVHQSGFPRPRHPSDGGKNTQRENHIHILEVIFARTEHFHTSFLIHRPTCCRYLNLTAARHIVTRDRALILEELIVCTRVHHLSPVLTCAGANVHYPVCLTHGIFIVLHHNKGIAHIPKLRQGVNQAPVIPLVQTDGRLIQHVEHTNQPGTDLGG